MAAAVDIASPEISPREQEKMDVAEEGNLFSPGNDVEVDAAPLSSKVQYRKGHAVINHRDSGHVYESDGD
jgi:hypothetical protein